MSFLVPTYLVDKTGVPIDGTNPLPTSGGGGTVDQGTSNADPADGWAARLTDGSAFITPAKTGQLPTTLGATTAAGSLSVGIATDQLSTLAPAGATTATTATVNCATVNTLFAANTSAKVRIIYNPVANGILYILYGTGTLTGESDCSFALSPGSSLNMDKLSGFVEYTGIRHGICGVQCRIAHRLRCQRV